MPSNLRIITTSVLFFIIFGPMVPALEFTFATLFTKGRFEPRKVMQRALGQA